MRVHFPIKICTILWIMDDYGRLKGRESGYANAISVPAEALYVEEKEPLLPLKRAADIALANFSEAALGTITPSTYLSQM